MADPTLRIRIAGDLSAIKLSVAELRKDFATLGTQITKTGNQGAASMSRMEKAVVGTQRAVKALATSFAVLQAVRLTVGLGDQFLQLNGVLKLATKTTEEFLIAQKGVFEIAQKTRAPVTETANTYGALERTTRKLGLSQTELLRTLETVNKAVGLTPVSAQAAQASLVQFSQALGGDFKAGAQELNSILEQTPGLAISIAEGLGIETSQLKKMGEEGKLSTELVVRGLLRISDSVDDKFKNVPKTVSGVIETIKNDLLFAIGGAGNAPLIEALENLRTLVSDPNTVKGLTAIAAAIVSVTTAAVNSISAIANFTHWIGEELAVAINGAAGDDLVRLGDQIVFLQKAIKSVENTSDFDPLNIFSGGGKEGRLAKLRAELEATKKVYDAAALSAANAARAGTAAGAASDQAAKEAADKAERDFQAAQARLAAREDGRNAVIQNAALLKDATDRMLAELDRVYAEGSIKLQDYFDRKRKLQIDAINAELEAAKAEADSADKAEQRAKALTRITILERQRNDVVKQTAIERSAAEKQAAQDLEDIEARIAEAGGDALSRKLLELDRERQALLKKFAQDPDAVTLVQRLFDVEAARARADQIKAEADRLITDLQNRETSVSQQISAGVISQAVGEKQLHAAREATIAQLVRQRDALQELYNVAPNAETLQAIEEFNNRIGAVAERNLTGMGRAIADLRAELSRLQEDFAGDAIKSLTDSLANLFTNLVDGSKSAGDALKDFVRGFAQAMLQIAARALATYLVLQVLDAIYPGLGKATAASLGAASHHTGGIAGTRPATRQVNPMIFGAAPRYHQGGVAGLAPNEVPAILEKGEEILPRSDPRHAMNGGGVQGASPGTRVVNVFDPSFVPDQMDSAAGEKIILNVIGKNPGRVRQLIG